MPIDFSCPISFNKRDNTVVRKVALIVLIIAIAAIVLIYIGYFEVVAVIMGILAIDFGIRAFWRPKYSPLATAGRGIVSILNKSSEIVDAAPKIFAARIGLIFSITSAVLIVLDLTAVATLVILLLAICAFLEAIFNFCLGCWMYSILPKKLAQWLAKEFVNE